jgi:peptidyl-tRNA hydrolase
MATAPIPQAIQNLPDPMASFKADEAKYDQQAEQVNKEQATATAALKARQAAQLQPVEQQREQMGQQFSQMLDKGPAQAPLPQNTAAHIDPKQMQDMGGIMLALAGLAGVMTRQPLMVSMRGMTGALQGLQAGDQKQFEEGYQQYKVNLDAALRQNDQKIKEFDRIVKSKEFSIREMDAQIKAMMKQNGDELGAAMVPFGDRLKHIQDQKQAVEKLRAESLKLEEVKIRLRMEAEQKAETHRHNVAVEQHQVNMEGLAKSARASTQSPAEKAATERMITAGNQIVHSVESLASLPATTSSGFFGQSKSVGIFSATKNALSNAVTDDYAQRYRVMITGIQRNLATLEAGGAATGLVGLSEKMNSVVVNAGQPLIVAMTAQAEIRQILQSALEPKIKDSRIPEERRELMKSIVDTVSNLVPFTQKDLSQLQRMQEKNPEATLEQVMRDAGRKVPGTTPQIPNAAPQQTDTKHQEAIQWAKSHPGDPRSAEILRRNGM